jgi:hypothetical protein
MIHAAVSAMILVVTDRFRWRVCDLSGCGLSCADVAVDRHGGDAAGGGDFGHGELAGVVHLLGLVDQRGCHFRFSTVSAAPGAGDD